MSFIIVLEKKTYSDVCVFSHFRLVLHKSRHLLTSDFQVMAVGKDNKRRVVDVDLQVYSGYVAGNAESRNQFCLDIHLIQECAILQNFNFA